MTTRSDPLREKLDQPFLESLVLGSLHGVGISRRSRLPGEVGDP